MGNKYNKIKGTFAKILPFKYVWLTIEENLSVDVLYRLPDIQLFVAEKLKECTDLLDAAPPSDKIIFVVDESLARNVIEFIHHQCAIKVIFVIRSTTNDPQFDEWTSSYIKVKSVSSIDILFSQIEHFKSRWCRTVDDFFSTDIFQLNSNQCDQSSIELNGSFLFMQLLLDILLRMTPLSTDKDEFIVECMKEYKGQPTTLQDITDFAEYYTSNTALFWYSRQIFLYPLLNKALRVENIDLLFLCRFFMRDIRDQLAKNQCNYPVRVYRGQIMSEEELNQLKSLFRDQSNEKIFVCMKSFFSTSIKRDVSEFYVGGQPEPGSCSVIFEIDADPAVCNESNPFAQLGGSSAIPNEEEVLFMMNSIFQITDIREDGPRFVISMKLCRNDDDIFKTVFESLKKDFGGEVAGYENEANLNSFATVLFNMGKFDLAGKFFRRFYNELSTSHRDRARLCHNIGNVALAKCQYKESLRWLNRALDLYQQTWPSDHPGPGNTYHCIGNLYQCRRKYSKSINAYELALDRFRRYYGNNHSRVVLCYSSLAFVYFRQKNFEQAVALYRHALIIAEKCLPSFHPDIAWIHYSLGLTFHENRQPELAVEHYEKALTIGLKTRRSNSLCLSTFYSGIGKIYREMGNMEKSVDYLTKAAVIANQALLGSRRRLNDKVHYVCRRCQQCVWAYDVFDRIKETYLVCTIFHSKLSFWFARLWE